MSIRYSYGDFTTKGHGVIEYADPSYSVGGKKRKRRSKVKSKFATRWPSPAPMKFKTTSKKTDDTKSIEQQAWGKYKKRYPGQQPKKGQIKIIIQELRKASSKSKKQKRRVPKVGKSQNAQNNRLKTTNKIDELVLALYKRRFPKQIPQKQQLMEIKQELIDARKKLGL